jgi:parallel beta-helix repeat protein
VDRAAALGGGTVRIGAGRYLLRNALTLRSNVRITGEPGKTVLAAGDGFRSDLACDGDCNERQITVADPSGFRVGDGVAVRDQGSSSGFEVTTATLTARVDERTFTISRPLYLDYMVSRKASAALSFPLVGGWDVENASVENLVLEGNRSTHVPLDGCRGGGIYLFQSKNVTIRNCIVRGYGGDGISFQVSEDVLVEDCLAEGNTGLGIHPGSGSQRPVVRNCRSVGNGGDGLYVCWRVKHGRFEGNEIEGNEGAGVSIGHKDTDNVFRNNRILANKRTGVLFREESEPMGAHRNVFERNLILDNGGAAITIRGRHRDVVFRDNVLGRSATGDSRKIGLSLGKGAPEVRSEGNRFQNVSVELEREQ